MIDTRSLSCFDYMRLPDEISTDESEMIKTWSTRNFFSQMMDVWGEVDKLPELYEKYKNTENFSAFIKQLEMVSKLCRIVRNCPECTIGEKEELKMAEWELYDFYEGDNTFNNTDGRAAAKWFDQWCYDINYDLL